MKNHLKHYLGLIIVQSVLVLPLNSFAMAPLTPEQSIEACQMAVASASQKYIAGKLSAVNQCLATISKEILLKNSGDYGKAAAICVNDFRKLEDSRNLGKSVREKFRNTVNAKCNPANPGVTHTWADIVGSGGTTVPEPMNVSNLDAVCNAYVGVPVLDYQTWVSCIYVLNLRSSLTTILAQWPRSVEWLTTMLPLMGAVVSPLKDSSKTEDAVVAANSLKAQLSILSNP